MKRAGHLMERVADLENLYMAYYKASRGKRGKSDVKAFARNVDGNLQKIRKQLLSGAVEVGRYRYFSIFDPKKRLICAASFPERVMHHAVMNVCHPVFERNLIADTYATRIGKGTYEAIGKAMKAMSRYGFVAKLDVRKYFDSILHEVLKAKLRRLFKDKALLSVFDAIIDSYSTSDGKGLPIGNLTSQYFANFYLSEMDHYAKETLRVPVYLRYMDDILLFADDKSTLKQQVEILETMAQSLRLEFKPPVVTKTEVGVSFLGYRLRRHRITLNARSRNRLRRKLTDYTALLECDEWSEAEYNAHLQPLLAFAAKGYTKRMRSRMISEIEGWESHAPTAFCAAVAGTTMRGTVECRTGTTTPPTTGTTTTGFALSFPSLKLVEPDGCDEFKQTSIPLPHSGTKRAASSRLSVCVGKSGSNTLNAQTGFGSLVALPRRGDTTVTVGHRPTAAHRQAGNACATQSAARPSPVGATAG